MSVFTEKVRPVAELLYFIFLLAYLMHTLRRRIHLAGHIVGLALCVYRALVVYRKKRVVFQILVFLVCIVRAARLIAEAPHDDGRMHLVSLIHPGRAVDVMSLPLRIVAYAVIAWRQLMYVCSVGLDVRLIHDIDAKFITELKQIRVRRIV